MAASTSQLLGQYVLERLKGIVSSGSEREAVYEDLGGQVLTKSEYEKKLESDIDFACREIDILVPPPPMAEHGVTITPREQHTIATQVYQFAEHQREMPRELSLIEFIRRRPSLVQSFNLRDIGEIGRTLRIEFGVKAQVPNQEELDSILTAVVRSSR